MMKKLLEKLHFDSYTLALIIGIAIFCLYISVASVLRFEHFLSGKLDLGNMMQTIWNTAHGSFFQFTDPYSTETVSRLGTHADFLLILLVPFYLLFPSAHTLLILQAIIVSLGSVVIYMLGRKLFENKLYSLLFALLFLMNPSVIRSSLYDFHAVVLATTFLLAAWYSGVSKKWVWFIVWCILAGICKEQVWLITGVMGLYFGWKSKEYLKGGVFALLSFVLCYYLISIAIPHANNAPHFALEYYSDYGMGMSGIIKGILTRPIQIVTTITDPERFSFLWQIISPVSVFPLLAPLFLVFMGPELLGYLLSNNHNMHVLYYQYTATLTPFIFIASMYGFAFLWRRLKNFRFKHVLFLALFTSGFFFAYRYSPLPFSREPQLDMFAPFPSQMSEVKNYMKTISSNSSVSSSNDIAAYLSNRKNIYIYPLGYDISDYVVIDKSKEDLRSAEFQKIVQTMYLKKDFENARYVVYRREEE